MSEYESLTGERPGLREAQPVRARSGLVRAASAYDAFVFAVTGISIGILLSWGQLYGTAFYPGSNWVLAIVFATAASAILAAGYQYWGRVFPRSGGDYVFLSRGVHPGVGLGVNVVYVLALQASSAYTLSIIQPLFASLGASLGEATGWSGFTRFGNWANTNWGFAVIGISIIAISTVIAFYGLKPTLRFIGALFVIGAVGTAIVTIALFLSDSGSFLRHLESSIGLNAAAVESTARENGFAYGGFSFADTMGTYGWYVTGAFFAPLVVYLGGEIKDVGRVFRYAIVGAALFVGLCVFFWAAALNNVVPRELTAALAYNNFVVPKASTANLFYPHELMAVLWGTHGAGLILTLIGYITVLAWAVVWTPVVIGFTQRAVLAWALDGLTPRWVAKVDERRHTPIAALLLSAVACSGWMLAFAFRPSFRTVALNVPLFSAIAITMLAGAIFPYVRRHFFDQSIVANNKVGSIPAMTIACAAAAAVLIGSVYNVWRDPIQGTDRTPVWVLVGVLIAVASYYMGLRIYRKRRGEDIGAVFKRIPVE